VENPQIRGQRERGFRTGVKEEEEKHRLWGQRDFFLALTKPRSRGGSWRREQGLCYSQFRDTVSQKGFGERKE